MLMRTSGPRALLVACVACGMGCVDLLTGAPCETAADCHGDICVSGLCEPQAQCSNGSACPSAETCNEGTGLCEPTDAGLPTAFLTVAGTVLTSATGPALSPGIPACLTVTIQNTGAATATQISGTLASTTAGITIVNGTMISAADLAIGGTETITAQPSSPHCAAGEIEIDLDSVAGNDVVASFTLTISDALSGETPLTFMEPIQTSGFLLFSVGVTDPYQGVALSPGADCLALVVENTGVILAESVTATLTSTTPGVTVVGGNKLEVGSVGPGYTGAVSPYEFDSACFDGDIEIDVSSSAALGTPASFTLLLSVDGATPLPLPFSVPVANGIDLSVESPTLTSSGCLSLVLENSGVLNAVALTGTLTSSTPGVTVEGGSNLALGTVYAGGSVGVYAAAETPACESAIEVESTSDVAPNTPVSFSLSLADDAGNQYSLNFALPLEAAEQGLVVSTAGLQAAADAGSAGTNCLSLQVEDVGFLDLYDVTGTVTATTAGVTIVNGTGLSLGDLFDSYPVTPTTASSPSCAANQIEVDEQSPPITAGEILSFVLTLTDSAGDTYTVPFQL